MTFDKNQLLPDSLMPYDSFLNACSVGDLDELDQVFNDDEGQLLSTSGYLGLFLAIQNNQLQIVERLLSYRKIS